MDHNEHLSHSEELHASPNLKHKGSMRRGVNNAETIEERQGFRGSIRGNLCLLWQVRAELVVNQVAR